MADQEHFEPWQRAGSPVAVAQQGLVRPLQQAGEGDAREVRQRVNLLSDSGMQELLDKMSGNDPPPPHIRKHLKDCVGALSKRVEKSLRLSSKKTALIDQANELERGRIPNGCKPFKVSVEVAELDLPIPSELTSFSIQFSEGSTFREAKEKLHVCSMALNKVLDARVMERQIASVRDSITADHFIQECGTCAAERKYGADQLMAELGLNPVGPSSTARVSKERLTSLYTSVMERVAEARRLEIEKKEKQETSIAKKVEQLRDTAPHDLLDAKIRLSVADALGKRRVVASSSKLDPSLDYGAAFSMIQADRIDLLEEAVLPKVSSPLLDWVFKGGKRRPRRKEKARVLERRRPTFLRKEKAKEKE